MSSIMNRLALVLGGTGLVLGGLGIFFICYGHYLKKRKDCIICGKIPPCSKDIVCQPKGVEGYMLSFIS